MLNRYRIGTIIAILAAAAAAIFGIAVRLYHKRSSLESPTEAGAEDLEAQFVREWTKALQESARTFNGLYQGLTRVVEGRTKKPEKVLKEWCARTRYRWEGRQPAALCETWIAPLLDGESREELGKWSRLLLQAAESSGITREKERCLTLEEQNVNDYTEWEGETLYVGDVVAVMTPAWYQDGKLLEQGTCRKQNEEEG